MLCFALNAPCEKCVEFIFVGEKFGDPLLVSRNHCYVVEIGSDYSLDFCVQVSIAVGRT